jgi:type I restriction enzyme, R subunit
MKAYEHFEDPEWDGELLEPEAPQPRPKLVGGEDNKTGDDRAIEGGNDEQVSRKKIKIKLSDGKERIVQHIMATSF